MAEAGDTDLARPARRLNLTIPFQKMLTKFLAGGNREVGVIGQVSHPVDRRDLAGENRA